MMMTRASSLSRVTRCDVSFENVFNVCENCEDNEPTHFNQSKNYFVRFSKR